MAQKVTSTDIKLALKEFHNGKPSYFITECKTCSTYFPDPQGLLKFDGLAITKSYTKPNIIGYEIKVSRNDFLQDNKWHLYLQYCNEFYFVVPKGLVKKEELPDHVGLIYFNPDTKGLRTVKKALYRQIEEPVGVYKYIIFSRLEEDRIPFYNDRAEYCKDYLEDKVVKSAIGQRLGTKLAKDLEDAEKRLKSLQSAEKELQAWSRARDEGVGVMEDFIGKPFTATTMSELNYLVNAPLESINRELREELGIELYVNTLPQIEDNSVSGILRVKRVGEPVRFI